MYAIIQAGGRQYRVAPGDRLLVDRMPGEPGSTIDLADVRLLAPDGGDVLIGTPLVAGAKVAATVVGHPRGEKLLVFKYKPKKRYRRRMGFRAALTELRIEAVEAPGGAPNPRPRARAAARPRPEAPVGEAAGEGAVAQATPRRPRRDRTEEAADGA